MRYRSLFIVPAALAFFLPGCAGSAPRVEMLKPETIAAARTFGPIKDNPLTLQGKGIPEEVGRWIGDAATAELEARGYRRAENPDLVGRALVAVAAQQGQWIEASSPGSLPRPVIQTRDWNEGTLVLELFDRRTNEMAWRGTAREAVGRGSGEQQVKDAVRRMFADFPSAR
jgi:Domain of unknown function (DUF4136)